MAQAIPDPEPAGVVPVAFLDCERLDCYRAAVEFQAIAACLVSSSRRLGALRDQLDRASVSIVLNVAEGAGRRTARDKAHFFTIARERDKMRSRPRSPSGSQPVHSLGPTATAARCWFASFRC